LSIRAWLFNVDESEGRTERVKGWKAQLGLQKDEEKARNAKPRIMTSAGRP